MRKTLLITIGIILILFVLGIWVYLMLFGTPESSQEVFTDLGFEITPQPVNVVDPQPTLDSTAVVDTTGETLRQLTTRPVAGFVSFRANDEEFVRYAEQGTGHVYELALTSGVEVRISATTIPRVTEAEFSDDGTYVALTSHNEVVKDVFVGSIDSTQGSGVIDGQNLPPNADEIDLDDHLVYYTTTDSSGTTGFRLDLLTNKQQEWFTVPFRSIRVIWPYDQIFFYNRTTASLEGSIYEITDGTFRSLTNPAFGNTALINPAYILQTRSDGDQLFTTATNRSNESVNTNLGIAAIPEKCTFDTIADEVVFCASPLTLLPPDYTEDWYKGVISSVDSLWEISLVNGEAILLIDLSDTAGRLVDVTKIQSDTFTNNLFFINKVDNTLWLYDLLAE